MAKGNYGGKQRKKAKHKKPHPLPKPLKQPDRPDSPPDNGETATDHSNNEVQSPMNQPNKRERFLLWVNRWDRVLQVIVPSILTLLILVAIIVQAIIYQKQYRSMEHSIGETQRNREIEYRAYVGVKGATFQAFPDNPAWAAITLVTVNTGRTSVRDGAVLKRAFEQRNEPPPEDAVVTDTAITSKTAYVPNIEHETYVAALQTTVADILKAQAAANPADPLPTPLANASPMPVVPSLTRPKGFSFGKGYYLYGTIDYEDIFSRPHRTKFCLYIAERSGGFIFCPTYNSSN